MIAATLLVFGALPWYVCTLAAGGGAMLLVPMVGFLLGPHLVAPTVTIGSVMLLPSGLCFFGPISTGRWPAGSCPVAFWGPKLGPISVLRCTPVASIFVGVFLMSTVFQYRLGKTKYSFPMRLPYFFILGLVTAFLSGIIGAIGPVKNPFFLNYGIDKENLLATKALNTLVLQGTKILTCLSFEVITKELLT
ncbi:hypothetical protein Misp06_01437 [Microbulbifer sp. NBRC 101763]|uniref:hypothetical protein n=1 Tax=Microbulbifer sp. NBRC 101763 TaxID=1113820 RepID=UPI0030AD1928